MYKHILIPTDGSPTAEKAVDAGLGFASESGARVTLFTAVPEYEIPGEAELLARHPVVSVDEHNRRSATMARSVLGPAEERARTAGIPFDSDFVQSNRPSQAIIAAARGHGCDAIFMATHARTGFAKLWHGSETEEVLTGSSIPTLVYR